MKNPIGSSLFRTHSSWLSRCVFRSAPFVSFSCPVPSRLTDHDSSFCGERNPARTHGSAVDRRPTDDGRRPATGGRGVKNDGCIERFRFRASHPSFCARVGFVRRRDDVHSRSARSSGGLRSAWIKPRGVSRGCARGAIAGGRAIARGGG